MYKKDKSNANADESSRIQINEANTNDIRHFDQPSSNNVTFLNNSDNLSTIRNIAENLDVNDPQLKYMEEDNNTVHTSEENPIFSLPISETPINFFQNQIFLKVVLLHLNAPKIVRLFQSKIRTMIEVREDDFENEVIKFFKEFVLSNKLFAVYIDREDLIPRLCNILKNTFKNPGFKLLLCNQVLEDVKDLEQQEKIMKDIHESKMNHRGIQETETEMKRKFYWPNIRNSVTTYINNCTLWQVMKYDRNPPKQKFSITPTPAKPFKIVHADTFTIKKQKFLTIIDKFSKYGQAYPLDSLTAVHVPKGFINFFTHHGVPKLLVLDNGSELKNSIIKDLASLHKIDIHYTTPLNPNSNSTIERFHSTIIEHLRILGETKKDLNILDQMPYAILGYSSSIHSATKQRPIDIINGHLDLSNPEQPF